MIYTLLCRDFMQKRNSIKCILLRSHFRLISFGTISDVQCQKERLKEEHTKSNQKNYKNKLYRLKTLQNINCTNKEPFKIKNCTKFHIENFLNKLNLDRSHFAKLLVRFFAIICHPQFVEFLICKIPCCKILFVLLLIS